MRFIIQLEDGRYVKRSLHGWKLEPQYSHNKDDAEVWVDQKAAVAWCEERNEAATVMPIDIVVPEVVKAKPRVVKSTKDEPNPS